MPTNPLDFSLSGVIRTHYDQLYAARFTLVEYAITPRGQAAIGTLDECLRNVHSLLEALALWGPMLEGSPGLQEVLLSMLGGKELSEDDVRKAVGDDVFNAIQNREGANPE